MRFNRIDSTDIGVKDVCCRFNSTVTGGRCFDSGMTSADFQTLGRVRSRREVLNIVAMGFTNMYAKYKHVLTSNGCGCGDGGCDKWLK